MSSRELELLEAAGRGELPTRLKNVDWDALGRVGHDMFKDLKIK